MDPAAVDEMLRSTLEDQRLSRGERRALKETVAELRLSEEDRRFWRNQAFALAEEAVQEQKGSGAAVLDWLHDVVKAIGAAGGADRPAPVHEVYFSPGEGPRQRISGLIDAAARRLDICVFTITDNAIASRIESAHRRKVRVRIITDDDKSTDRGSDIDRLSEAGIPVRVDRTEAHMHHKFAVADEATLLTGSYNWTRSAARDNEENLVVTNAPELVTAFTQQFEKLWDSLGPDGQ